MLPPKYAALLVFVFFLLSCAQQRVEPQPPSSFEQQTPAEQASRGTEESQTESVASNPTSDELSDRSPLRPVEPAVWETLPTAELQGIIVSNDTSSHQEAAHIYSIAATFAFASTKESDPRHQHLFARLQQGGKEYTQDLTQQRAPVSVLFSLPITEVDNSPQSITLSLFSHAAPKNKIFSRNLQIEQPKMQQAPSIANAEVSVGFVDYDIHWNMFNPTEGVAFICTLDPFAVKIAQRTLQLGKIMPLDPMPPKSQGNFSIKLRLRLLDAYESSVQLFSRPPLEMSLHSEVRCGPYRYPFSLEYSSPMTPSEGNAPAAS